MDATPQRTLSELSPLNTPLYTVFATDVDEGVNKMVLKKITNYPLFTANGSHVVN